LQEGLGDSDYGSAGAVTAAADAAISMDRLWSGVLDNMAKDAGMRTRIEIAHVPQSAAAQGGQAAAAATKLRLQKFVIAAARR